MLKLYYVRGINETDTPHFNSLVEQEEYFEEKLITTIDAFFPPHYTDRLQFSNDDLDFNSQINYISLDFNGKTYYYFISDMEYITEDLISVSITMDTIQTYMFDIQYTNARISRRTIKRWNDDGTINRDYIRENFGNNLYINQKYIDYTVKDSVNFCGWFAIKTIKEKFGAITDPTYSEALDPNNVNTYTQDGTTILLVPALNFRGVNPNTLYFDYNKLGVQQGVRYNSVMIQQTIHNAQEDPDIIDIYYLPHETLYNVKCILSNGAYSINWVDDSYTLLNTTSTDKLYLQCKKADIYLKKESYTFDFERNEDDKVPFDKKYIPQLLDENYYQYLFGERMFLTSYPLSKLRNININNYSNCDIFTGFRNYWILGDHTTDRYMTMKTANTKESAVMLNDQWKQYVANNKGSLVIGNTLALMNSVGGVNKFAKARGKFITKKGTLGNKGKALSKMIDDSEILDIAENNINKQFAPETMTQGNEYTNDVLNQSYHRILKIDCVSNINDVATIYETIGYRVDEFIQGSPIFKDRKIFNYIECSDIDLAITKLCSQDIINDIKTRYINGLRYWNINTIKEYEINIGDICIYDNVELYKEDE